MLKELGAFGAFVGFGLVFAQLGQVFGLEQHVGMGSDRRGGGRLCRPSPNPLAGCCWPYLIIIMIPQATTELGTNGWITALMEDPMKAAGFNATWVLVYTSAIMLILRFCAGPLVHKFSPVGLLLTCSALAALGILALSQTAHAGIGTIFAAATLFGVGITFFWPTILGLTSEQCPRGGALTLNASGRHRDAGRGHSGRTVPGLHAGNFNDASIADRQSAPLRTGRDETKLSARRV
ncbi:MAG: hypothetical protein WDN00_17085 [Limisphaerales bacterium]